MTAPAGLRCGIMLILALLLVLPGASAAAGDTQIDFGTNQGEWAFDGVCNDPRFVARDGPDQADRLHMFQDAADCRAAFDDGRVRLRASHDATHSLAPVEDLGNDSGPWAGNGVCNDPRFVPDPRYPSAVEHRAGAKGRDATDCFRGQLLRHVWTTWKDTGIAFGDDSSDWAYDGECDDPRFTGEAMAGSLSATHMLADATDCRQAFEDGRVALFSFELLWASASALDLPADFDFGDDSSEWAFDGECDDPRFAGEATAAELDQRNEFRDATDCGKALLTARVQVHMLPDGFEEGEDDGPWAGNGICNDPRFVPDPRHSSATKHVDGAEGRDATDCVRSYLLRHVWTTWEDTGVAFGDDSGEWARDGECDDPRFVGEAMASSPNAMHILRDATDCRESFEDERVALFSPELLAASPGVSDLPPGFELGDDSSEWAFDGECDDLRFVGEAMAAAPDEDDVFSDRTDCGRALLTAGVQVRSLPEGIAAGEDDGPWAGNKVCNDPRFVPDPRHSFAVEHLDGAEGRDATDCVSGYLLRRVWTTWKDTGIAFGDESSEWADDGECDDPRFVGEAMAGSPSARNLLRDATDCREAFEDERIELFSVGLLAASPQAPDLPPGFELGDDSGEWAFDGECDDPRFGGEAVAAGAAEDDAFRDATDCGKALLAGTATIRTR